MARPTKPSPIEVGQPEWPPATAVTRLRELLGRGRELLGRGAPKNDREGWRIAVDSVMASAFGRNSDEHRSAKSAIQPLHIPVVANWGAGPDDYPERLAKQLSVIDEYIKILEQRAADSPAPLPKPEPSAIERVLHVVGKFHRVARQLRVRHEQRKTLEVEDEYDVQDLLHALLTIFFDDIRPEDGLPATLGNPPGWISS